MNLDFPHALHLAIVLIFGGAVLICLIDREVLPRLGKLATVGLLVILSYCLFTLSGCSAVKKTKVVSSSRQELKLDTRVEKAMEERSRTIIQEEIDTIVYLPRLKQTAIAPFAPVSPAFPGLIQAVLHLNDLGIDLQVEVDTLNKTVKAIAEQTGKAGFHIKAKKTTTTNTEKSGRIDSAASVNIDAKEETLLKTGDRKPDYSWLYGLAGTITAVAVCWYFSPRVIRWILRRRKA
ncbi:MAG: hypothetical protein INR69_17395 [Mucilaginibacter polytrichastri]|nr:hypothetical protein [Mucilaginibacter polytrichastri]